MAQRSTRASRKVAHALSLLCSLERLRTTTFACDFVVKAEAERFDVHRNILAACSDYFKAMFSHETKEAREGVVEMKEIEAESMRECIKFMYTGEAEITMENVQSVLHASGLMQLNSLVDHCFEFMHGNLTAENCFVIKNLAQAYNNADAREAVEAYVVENFEHVVATEGFLLLDKCDVCHFISKVSEKSHDVVWRAVLAWVNHDLDRRKEHLFKLLKLLNLKSFPFKCILKSVWSDNLVQDCEEGKQLIVSFLFSNLDVLKSNIGVGNCFLLQKLCKQYEVGTAEMLAAIDAFMMNHFEAVAKEDEFDNMGHEDIMHLFKVLKTTHWHQQYIDVLKWKGATKWVLHDIYNRRAVFPQLLKCIRLEWFSIDYIEKNVRTEPLVRESHECKDLLMDVMAAKISGAVSQPPDGAVGTICRSLQRPSVELESFIAVLDRKNREIRGLSTTSGTWTRLFNVPQVSPSGFSSIVNFQDGLYMLYNKSLYRLQNNDTWEEKAEMTFKHDRSSRLLAFQEKLYVVSATFLAYYNPKADAWIEFRQPDDFQTGFCAAGDEDHIYSMGGYPLLSQARKYDPVLINWSNIAPMIYERSGASAVEMNGFIYVMGGRVPDEIHQTVEAYFPATDTWTEITSMQVPRCNFASCFIAGKMYAVGGHDSVEAYDCEEARWDLVERINARPFGISACGFTCWKVKSARSDGTGSVSFMLL